MSLDEISADVEQVAADAVAADLENLAAFIRSHPRWAPAVIGQSFHLCVHSGAEWDERTAELDGNDDSQRDAEYLLHTRSFGTIDVQAYVAKDVRPVPAPLMWTGSNDAEFAAFAKAAMSFSWSYAELDDGNVDHVDRTVLSIWPNDAELYLPVLARPGDTVHPDGSITRGGA
ncbi:MAG TPA: hypothetical protein VGW74_07065 [Propionibacteriaceae bacterium]|nr:hypothetical protein [Propionibacteriaceae bacterium]